MTNHPNRKGKFELTFVGDITVGGIPKRHRRFHKSFDDARELALRVLYEIDDRNAHPAIVRGPGCGEDGITIA